MWYEIQAIYIDIVTVRGVVDDTDSISKNGELRVTTSKQTRAGRQGGFWGF